MTAVAGFGIQKPEYVLPILALFARSVNVNHRLIFDFCNDW